AIGGSLAGKSKKLRAENLKRLDFFREKAESMTKEELDQAIAEFDREFDGEIPKSQILIRIKK
ncbi:MAG: hypothetical protein ACRC8A_13135, partial [Microcoleaceae cyanobacterium]